MSIDLFVFDIAGTTVRDDGVVHHAFEATLRSADMTADESWIRARMGWNKVQVFAEALRNHGRSEGLAADLAARFSNEIRRTMDESPPVSLEGAVEAMRAVRDRGGGVAFNTGYSTALAEEIIGRLGWNADAVIGSDLVAHGRPAPDLILLAMNRVGTVDAGRVGVAGDTPSDLMAGAAAGCRWVVGVGHGTHSLAELSRHPHTHLLANLRGLSEVLDG